VDFCGPFSHDEGEYKYVFTAIDAFTRWVHFIPTYDLTAESAAEALLHKVITLHGCPCKLVSDRGPHFIAGIWNSLSERLGIKLSLTTPRHPQANGVAERVHRILNAAIRTARRPDEPWVDLLPFIEWAHRTTPIEHSDLPPYEMLFGRDPRMPVDLQFAQSPDPETDIKEADRTSWLSLNLQRLALIRQMVRKLSAEFKYKAAEQRDRKRRDVDWKPGDLVLVYMPTEKKGIPKKRLMQWSSMAKIVKRKSYNSFEVQREDKKGTTVYNVDRLFKMPPGTTNLSLKADTENDLLGVFEIPEDAKARKEAMERKQAARDQERRNVENKNADARLEEPAEAEDPVTVRDILKERADDIRSTMRGPASVEVDDLVLFLCPDSARWLLGKVLSFKGRGRRKKVLLHVYWKMANRLKPKANNKMDWAPLWHKRKKSSQQSAKWEKPAGYVPYTSLVPVRDLKMIGLKLQKYSNGPRGRLRHRIDPAWWEVISNATPIFEKFGPV